MASKLSLFLAELKRRKVTRVAVVYILVGLGVIEAMDIIGDRLLFPEWAIQFVIVLVLIGFPIALVLAWALEVTPEGIQRTSELSPEQLATQTPSKWSPSSWVLSGVGLVVILSAGYFVFFRGGQEGEIATDEHRVAVLPLDNLTGDPTLDGLGLTASDWISEGLFRTELVRVVPFTEVLFSNDALSASGAPSAALSLTWPEETGATIAVVGSYSSLGDSLEFRLRVVDAEGAVLSTIDPVRGVGTNPSLALGGLQTRVMASVAGVVAPGHEMSFSTLGRLPPQPEAHAELLEAMRTVGNNNRAALEALERALAIDPDYLTALIMIPPVLYNLRRYVEADSVCQTIEARSGELIREQRWMVELECSDNRLTELNAAKKLLELSSMTLYRVALHGVWANRPQEVLTVCSDYDPNVSRMTGRWANAMGGYCLQALHMLGEFEGQLSYITEKRDGNPTRWQRYETEALIALGRLREADQLIEERVSGLSGGASPVSILDRAALDFDAHGHRDAAAALWNRALEWLRAQSYADQTTGENRRQRGEILLYLERDSEALDLLEPLARENPGDLSDQGRLGVVLARLGDRVGAERVSESLRPMAQPFKRGEPTAWRSAISAQLGDFEEAVGLLDQAIEEGWQVGLNPHRSQILKPLRGYGPYERLVAPKG